MKDMTELDLLVQQRRLILAINKLQEELSAVNAELNERTQSVLDAKKG